MVHPCFEHVSASTSRPKSEASTGEAVARIHVLTAVAVELPNMADFAGMTVKVTLNQPPNTVVHGKVKEVIAGQTLSLQDVFFPASGTSWSHWTVQGNVIADLEVLNTNPAPISRAASSQVPTSSLPIPTSTLPVREPIQVQPSTTRLVTPAQSSTRSQAPGFVDPAILSYAKSPVHRKVSPKPNGFPATPLRPALARAAESLPFRNASPFVGEPAELSNGQGSFEAKEIGSSSLQYDGTAPTAVQDRNAGENIEDVEQGEREPRKKKRQRQKTKKDAAPSNDPPPVMNVEVSRNGNDMSSSIKRGKGWRQTPLLQPSPQPSASGRKKTRRQREEDKEAQNGWATEDATDIQDLGEFDFEANHKLFDKQQVFDQLRKDDTTADEDRLVSHNKLARPGTYGGKNLHPTENVLSPGTGRDAASSDADTELNFNTGRSSSRHSVTKRQQMRTNSIKVDVKPFPVNSLPSDRALSRSATSLSKSGKSMPAAAGIISGRDRTQSPQSAVSASKLDGKAVQRADIVMPDPPYFVISPSRSLCPVLHPSALEMLELETTTRYGLTADAITETAARSIAEVAMGMFDKTTDSRRGSRANAFRGSMTSSMQLGDGPPVIVILAGNHATGSRALAAARHLACRKVKIILARTAQGLAEAQAEQNAKQTLMLKKMMHAGANIKLGPWDKASNYIKNLSGPPTVIIDALLAGSTYDSLLAADDEDASRAQQQVRQMIDWANRSRAPVLSISCPSGVSSLDSGATIVDGEPLAVRPDKVLALGAPMQGLLEAMKRGERWDVSLADTGINIALKRDDAVAFGSKWIVPLKFASEDAGLDGES